MNNTKGGEKKQQNKVKIF